MLRTIDFDRVRADGYGFQVEMTYLTELRGGRIVEVPICFRDRTLGSSKMSTPDRRRGVRARHLVGHARPRSTGSCTHASTPVWPGCDTEAMALTEFTVAGALVESPDGLLLVQNQRRNGTLDWSTPGGVIDATDASLLHGLAREVEEETGLRVTEWEGPLYEVRATALELGWGMRCEVHRALGFDGTLRVDDPDGIVVDACFAPQRPLGRPPRHVRRLGARAARRVARAPVGPGAAPPVHVRRPRCEPRGGPGGAHVAGRLTRPVGAAATRWQVEARRATMGRPTIDTPPDASAVETQPLEKQRDMPLSEDEQRILKEIEENLSATDPKLVQQVSDTTLYRHAARVIKWSAAGFVAGLVLMVLTFTTTLVLGVVGFAIMLGCALTIEHNLRKLGRAGIENLTGSMRNGTFKNMLGNASTRWRDRWGRDDPPS